MQAAPRPRITPPVVDAIWWITCSVWNWNAWSGWSPVVARAAVGAVPNAVSGADAARASPASARPMAEVRRSSRAIASLSGTASASATATGMARSRNGRPSASATRGPMTLPPVP